MTQNMRAYAVSIQGNDATERQKNAESLAVFVKAEMEDQVSILRVGRHYRYLSVKMTLEAAEIIKERPEVAGIESPELPISFTEPARNPAPRPK